MSTLLRAVVLVLAVACTAIAAHAQAVITIRFDDIAPGSMPGEQYATPYGIHFSSGSAGVIEGLAFGDPGNWALEGTDGSYFLGFNGSPYAITVTTDSPIGRFSVDVSRSNGSQATDTFTLAAYAGATLVDTATVTLATINVWSTVTVQGAGINRLELSGAGASFHPFGIDRLVFDPVPEPSAHALILAGGLALFARGLVRRRRV